ncbi:zinc ribbon domain-containing protein [Streptomyces sp. NPDC055506]
MNRQRTTRGFPPCNSRKSQAEFVCSSCGFTCNADTNASINSRQDRAGSPAPGEQPVLEG